MFRINEWINRIIKVIESSSTGRRLYIQVWYRVFYMHQYSQFLGGTVCSVLSTAYTTFFLKTEPQVRNM